MSLCYAPVTLIKVDAHTGNFVIDLADHIASKVLQVVRCGHHPLVVSLISPFSLFMGTAAQLRVICECTSSCKLIFVPQLLGGTVLMSSIMFHIMILLTETPLSLIFIMETFLAY